MLAATSIVALGVLGEAQTGLLDSLSHSPPAILTYAYNTFAVPAAAGASYVDPVFGTTVQRVTSDHSVDDIYARNMWWNADESRYLHRNPNGHAFADYLAVIDIATGTVTHNGIPIGTVPGDEGFDPVDPNVLYYHSGSSIHQVTLNSNGTWSDDIYFTAPGGQTLRTLGATINWLDTSGRYMVVRYGPEPSVYLYDRQNLAAGPYANPVDGASTIDAGSYVGISPDGKYLVGYQGADGTAGQYDMGQGVSWAIDHTNRAVAPTLNVFWSLCGDHGSFISSSDGRDYMVVSACNSYPELWRVDITNDVTGLNENSQRALPTNLRLMTWLTWNEVGNHVSTAARGPHQDWAFYSSEDSTDTYNSGSADASGNITPWHAYRQEIIAFNVLTGEVRRLAHHRSRSVTANYYNAPRVSASWGGRWVGWASNFNQQGCPGCYGVTDIYAVQFADALIGPTLTAGAGSVAVGGTVSFTVAGGPGNALDWVGFYCPDTTGDISYGSNWKYLNNAQTPPGAGLTVATVTFTAPTVAGRTCNARLFQNNGLTRLATSGLVTITGPTVSEGASTVAAGGTMSFTVSNGPGNALDWVALYCPAAAADPGYLTWKYLNNAQTPPGGGVTGATVTFTAPTTPGQTCDARLFLNNGLTKLAKSGTVTVKNAVPTITSLAPSSVSAGSPFTLTVNGTGFSSGSVAQLDGNARTTTFVSPTQVTAAIPASDVPVPATHTITLFNPTPGGGTSSGAALTVTTGPTLSAGASFVGIGGMLSFTVTAGPGNVLDWVGLYCPGSLGDNAYGTNWKYLNNSQTAPAAGVTSATVTFPAPSVAGQTCNARLFANNGITKLATSGLVTITGPTVTAGASTVAAGGTMSFAVAGGPGNARDWVGLFCPATTASDSAYVTWKYLNNSQTAPSAGMTSATVTFVAPSTPGATCNARLFVNDGFTRIATSGTVTAQ